MSSRTTRATAAALAALVYASAAELACTRREAPPTETPGPSLTLVTRADTTGIFPNDPAQAEGFTYTINDHLFQGLVGFGSQDELVPSLAEQWTTADDRHWLFRLREGVRFSDGTPLSAKDVVASYHATLQRPFPHHRSLGSFVESVRAVDPKTVEIVTRYPFAVLPAQLTTVYVFPAREVAKPVVPPIGTGPYVLESREPGVRTRLKRNPYYWGPAPAYESVTFEVMPDAARRVEAVTSGRAAVADQIPLDQVARLEKDARLRVLCRPAFRVLFLEFQVDARPYQDVRVRRAIDLAIDRQELNERALAGRALPATQIIPSSVAGFNPAIPLPKADRPAARRLLAEAGFPKGTTLVLDGPSDRYTNDAEVLREVARQLAEIGVTVEVRAVPKAQFFQKRAARESPFHLMGWSSPTLQAWSALTELVHTPSPDGPPSWNVTGLSDRALDALIDEANRSTKIEEQNTLFASAFETLDRMHVFIPLVVLPEAVATSTSVAWDAAPDLGLEAYRMRPMSGAETATATDK